MVLGAILGAVGDDEIAGVGAECGELVGRSEGAVERRGQVVVSVDLLVHAEPGPVAVADSEV